MYVYIERERERTIYVYIYIYIYIVQTASLAIVGWRYLSNATCRMRPSLFYAFVVVSRIAIICEIIRHV